MIYINEPYVTMSWDEENHFIYTEWKAYAEAEKYRDPMEQGIKVMKERKCNKVLVDSRNLKVINPLDQKWTIEDWTPRAVAAGLRYNTFIIPKSALAQSSLKRVVNYVGKVEIESGFFSDIEEAKAWLNTKK